MMCKLKRLMDKGWYYDVQGRALYREDGQGRALRCAMAVHG